MEENGSGSNIQGNHPSKASNSGIYENSTEKGQYVNRAEIAWQESRKEWVGDHTENSKRTPREPIMSWTTTYEDLLSSIEPFQQPIPLAEMVDFLVDIWHEEGLYD